MPMAPPSVMIAGWGPSPDGTFRFRGLDEGAYALALSVPPLSRSVGESVVPLGDAVTVGGEDLDLVETRDAA